MNTHYMFILKNSVPFCNSQKTKLHYSDTLKTPFSTNGCSNFRHHNRNNNTILLCCLYNHHRRHLQEPLFLISNTLYPNTPLSYYPSINLGFLADFVLAQIDKMSKIDALVKQICFFLIIATSLGVLIFGSSVEAKVLEDSKKEFHQCNHGHGQGHHHDHEGHHHHHHDHGSSGVEQRKLLEELAEEEDLKLYGFGSHDNMDERHHHHHDGHGVKDLTGLGLWVNAMGCSLLVSLASLICLILLPLIFIHGKPSKVVVDSLALFGAGAMLGDAFLHQLPHAFGGGHSHSHDDHLHDHSGHSHAHSLEDLSVGLSILAGIVLFLIVEKLVRYVEDFPGGVDERSHGHHHHHHMHYTKLKDDNDADGNLQELSQKDGSLSEKAAGGSGVDGVSADSSNGEKPNGGAILRKRNTGSSAAEDNTSLDAANCSTNSTSTGEEQAKPRSSLVFGYLNLFSDGVHNFTDGMALGSAFLLYGSVGGWSRTLFLLAHELPQEIGDFGILVRSGFSVSKALFFNFLSALVALAGTALALTLGQDSGHSSLIEGFTAGGFIYISVAGVLAEMNNSGRTTLVNTVIQLISLVSGMAVALCISLVE
ncbi:IAA-alanine resistance protein 1 isoform X2 [Solanum dulcamara]|uniref:IAA-alanine resistance protein 1 isoform X2 n=1 Tax=Solanum dulcamara TaxID=45834 RepID=UPI002486CCFE|nr:IAA-alanine resistance protein 1 isoform X2 [Solanum dulcamara]